VDRKSWRSYTANLSSEARLTSYDLRGQGDSSPPGEPEWAEHITVRDFAMVHPERVQGLVLAGPAMSPHGPQGLRRITKSWLKSLDTSGLSVLYDQLYPLVSGDRPWRRPDRSGHGP
jgi:pimeloyl-ACP methyl ester carboxylesterase